MNARALLSLALAHTIGLGPLLLVLVASSLACGWRAPSEHEKTSTEALAASKEEKLGPAQPTSVIVPLGEDLLHHVDPRIGTGGEGHTYPGATYPFGMVQVSPDTARPHFRGGFPWCAGYRYEDPTILGFSHTHFSGTGHSDLGDILITPTSGERRLERSQVDPPRPGYDSSYRHESEVASPGYYAVTLDDAKIRAEVSATPRAAIHRYRYATGSEARVLVDLGHSIYDHEKKVLWSEIHVVDDHTVIGWRETSGWAAYRKVAFRMEFSQPFRTYGGVDRSERSYRGFGPRGPEYREVPRMFGQDLIAYLEFGDLKGEPLLVKVALSGVDQDGATANMRAELSDWDFERVHQRARRAWANELGRYRVQGTNSELRSFYTSLYHTMLAPTIFDDVDGRYRGADQAIHHVAGGQHYDTFSLWDTFRALHPLLILTQPDRVRDMAHSLLDFAEQSPHQSLPVWSFHSNETFCMIGYHAVSVLADALVKGIEGIDTRRALKLARASAENKNYAGLGEYMRLGYVPIDREREAASKTLEYAYDDWAIAQMAMHLGDQATGELYLKRSQSFERLFDPNYGLMRAKLENGEWREPFDPDRAQYGGDYTEGNAWQYSWFVPHDVARLIALMGGNDKFVQRLDHLFETQVGDHAFAQVEDITGLIGHYAHGNEPSHHVAYLYNYAGQPWRTQERVRQIVQTLYKDSPDGLPGNDDCGQMSAWYVFSALGFYPVTPGSTQYVMGTPLLDRAEIILANGRTFEIVAKNRSEQNFYIQAVSLNGKPLHRSYLEHAEIMAGGRLEFVLGPKPNVQWASDGTDLPFSQSLVRTKTSPNLKVAGVQP
jgi:predicted alpha-1,2-mannosidase